MSSIRSRQNRDGQNDNDTGSGHRHASDDDIEANAGRDQSRSSGSDTHGGGSDQEKNPQSLPEYDALQRYISTYRETQEVAEEEEDEKQSKKKQPRWWQFWKPKTGVQGGGPAKDKGHVPDEWLETDIHQGISSGDVESRRKRFGWNELTAEKENLYTKFLGYFQGPILYGKYRPFPSVNSYPL